MTFIILYRQLTGEPSSCAVCGDVMKDLVQLICGHWSCKQCLSSDREMSDSPAPYPCVQCGKKPRHTEEDTGKFKYLQSNA